MGLISEELALRCEIEEQHGLLVAEADALALLILAHTNAYDVQVVTAARQVAARCRTLRVDKHALAVAVSGG